MALRGDCAMLIRPPTPRQRNPQSEAAKLGSNPIPLLHLIFTATRLDSRLSVEVTPLLGDGNRSLVSTNEQVLVGVRKPLGRIARFPSKYRTLTLLLTIKSGQA